MDKPEYSQVYSWPNLLSSYQKASRGKRNRQPAADFEFRLEDNLVELGRELRKRTYRPGAYVSFYIHEPKRRLISAAPFRDRVVHHAMCNVIAPFFERSFIFDSYANRVGKGTHRAVDRAQEFCRRFRYVLPCDIRQFFPSIDHDVLKAIIGRKIKDLHFRWLVSRILESGAGILKSEYDMVYFPGDDIFSINRPRGLPIGNLTSQFWANCYLNGIDHFVKRELGVKGYLRYVDDMLLFDDCKTRLYEFKKRLMARLANLRLTLHENRAQAQPSCLGFPFLGFVVFPHKRRLKRRKGIAFTRKLRRLVAAYADGEITLEQVHASVTGWVNHVRYGDTLGLRRAVLGSVILPVKRGGIHGFNPPVHQNI